MKLLNRLFAWTMPLVPGPLMRRLAGRYVAGTSLAEAFALIDRLHLSGYGTTLDILGEAVDDWSMVEDAMNQYLHAVDQLGDRAGRTHISIKPTQMGLLLDEGRSYACVERLARASNDAGTFFRYEMEDSATVDATLRLFHRLREERGAGVGCVLQSMLHRTGEDIEQLLAIDAPLNVRMVKGIYLEPESIAFQGAEEIRASFLAGTRRLLEGGAFVGLATHDAQIVEGWKAMLAEHPEWLGRSELQMLLGVREELRAEIRQAGLPVRVYVPYGEQWRAYVQRRLRKNPNLAGAAIRGLFGHREQLRQS